MGRPKGSTNKSKRLIQPQKALRGGKAALNKTLQAPLMAQDQHCKICGRVPFGKVVWLGWKAWRHDSCELGSEAWKGYYFALPKAHQQALEEFYQCTYKENT